MEEQKKSMSPQDQQALQDASKQLEFDVEVKKTGQRRQIAGYDAEESVIVVTMHGKGQKLEESGGAVLTSNVLLGPKIAALDEMAAFSMKFFKQVFGTTFVGLDPRTTMSAGGLLPGFAPLMERLGQEQHQAHRHTAGDDDRARNREERGSDETVGAQQSGGGLGGILAGKLLKGASQQRTKAFTSTNERISIGTSVSDADLAIPAGFKEKK